ncbi:hypothetical protein DFH07DRAFT_781010 [Mycena maculata]|uniref:Uncharacterized protein n=1 Tax=Mycena maculata TaxID=230809 RepID=A0AAD7MU96_9AGAR|nr:hypothetical protein DFH07DRAFT_781010 [Mycena maculata]
MASSSDSETGSESNTGECTAHDKKTKEECKCDHYVESLFSSGRCGNCTHRRTHHLLGDPSEEAVTAEPSAPDTLLPANRPVSRSEANPSSASSSKLGKLADPGGSSVSSILRSMGIKRTAGSTSFSLPVPPNTTSSKARGILGRADQESNSGMRPLPELKGQSKNTKPRKGKKKDHNATTFKVASIVVVPCGVEFSVRYQSVESKLGQ